MVSVCILWGQDRELGLSSLNLLSTKLSPCSLSHVCHGEPDTVAVVVTLAPEAIASAPQSVDQAYNLGQHLRAS